MLNSKNCVVDLAKIIIKQKMKKVFNFAEEVFGKDELSTLAGPYTNISAMRRPVPAAKN